MSNATATRAAHRATRDATSEPTPDAVKFLRVMSAFQCCGALVAVALGLWLFETTRRPGRGTWVADNSIRWAGLGQVAGLSLAAAGAVFLVTATLGLCLRRGRARVRVWAIALQSLLVTTFALLAAVSLAALGMNAVVLMLTVCAWFGLQVVLLSSQRVGRWSRPRSS